MGIVSDTLAPLDESQEANIAEIVKRSGPVIATGTAVFTNADNNINMTNIGVGVEVGDVIQFVGSTNNDSEFTIEFITDNDNVIVNAAHAGGTTSKSLVDETASVTATLLCKWFHASPGLGQGDVDKSITLGVEQPNTTGRTIEVVLHVRTGTDDYARIYRDGVEIGTAGSTSSSGRNIRDMSAFTVKSGSSYRIDQSGAVIVEKVTEVR